jgi:hypothetical protein
MSDQKLAGRINVASGPLARTMPRLGACDRLP